MIDIYDSKQIFLLRAWGGSVCKVTTEIKTDAYVSRISRLSYTRPILRLKLFSFCLRFQ